MSTMVDRPQQFAHAAYARKPLPHAGKVAPAVAARPPQLHTHQLADHHHPPPSGHGRSRTSSSTVFFPPTSVAPAMQQQQPPLPSQYQAYNPHQHASVFPGATSYQPAPARRTLSNATSSTASSGTAPGRSNSGLRRSSSARSGSSPTSYVALMRKQKATVWCDRAQYDDPRLLAQQRAARERAIMEIAGGPHHAPRAVSASSSVAAGVRSKIRHHGAPKASLYAPVTLASTGVPMRLSASEVDEGDSDDGDSLRQARGLYHHRSGSGRSSLGSGRRVPYANPAGRLSSNSTPPSGHNSSPSDGMADLVEEATPMPAPAGGGGDDGARGTGYFSDTTKTGLSTGSASSGERENSFGTLGQMPQHEHRSVFDQRKTSADELRRRGSVDDRTHTMAGSGRLFIANPDLSD